MWLETKGLIILACKISPRETGCTEHEKKSYNGLTAAYCPARMCMMFETLAVKLHFFLFSCPVLLCFETLVFIRWQGGKIFSFNLAGKSSSGMCFTTCTYQSHWALLNIGGKKGGIRCWQNARHCASAAVLLCLTLTDSHWVSHQSTPCVRG